MLILEVLLRVKLKHPFYYVYLKLPTSYQEFESVEQFKAELDQYITYYNQAN
ncbi:IS3 family transposase [Paenibacillus sp. NEAU-GSW1]|nr:IS3 family transposase [Paenibacillus sp. NEAU-GSW1]